MKYQVKISKYLDKKFSKIKSRKDHLRFNNKGNQKFSLIDLFMHQVLLVFKINNFKIKT